ncbi:MAG: chorismate synthase [Bacteroidetes bacterium]|nr:MAG: chorismate synthase [Bacteroidota bacterium]
MIRYFTSGESHGPSLTGIVEGMPAGVQITEDAIAFHLARRQQGYGRGGRMAFEKDRATIQSGVRFGETTGAPIALSMENRAYLKDDSQWPKVMAKEGTGEGIEKITLPRPGHADLTGVQKYRFDDIRPVIERSSARETAMRVACCTLARLFLKELGIEIGGHMLTIGSAGYESWDQVREMTAGFLERRGTIAAGLETASGTQTAAGLETASGTKTASGTQTAWGAEAQSDVRCLDPTIGEAMREEIKRIRKAGSSLGGIYEIVVTGLPAGLGSYVHYDRKLDGLLAQAILSTQAMKGVEFGLGFESGRRPGHEVHDEIVYGDGHPGENGNENNKGNSRSFGRSSDKSGGLEGGMTTGMPLILRGVMKPIPTMLKPLQTVDIETKTAQPTRYERSDVCAAPRAIVVAESVIAPVLANAILEKFGGDSMDEIRERFSDMPT